MQDCDRYDIFLENYLKRTSWRDRTLYKYTTSTQKSKRASLVICLDKRPKLARAERRRSIKPQRHRRQIKIKTVDKPTYRYVFVTFRLDDCVASKNFRTSGELGVCYETIRKWPGCSSGNLVGICIFDFTWTPLARLWFLGNHGYH